MRPRALPGTVTVRGVGWIPQDSPSLVPIERTDPVSLCSAVRHQRRALLLSGSLLLSVLLRACTCLLQGERRCRPETFTSPFW
jgi:hypothetical protein